ncbi:MAG TPA: hypothetical protein VH300_19180 [Thermoleophilaceae bacterium]|nr:hypothetical protein [Thermoleophilaceae bacterium]
MEAEVKVERVDVNETRNGNRRFVLKDSDGREYTTFRPQIGNEAAKYEGRRARIAFHEEERNGFTNVYLDGIQPAAAEASGEDGEHDAEEAAWRTAVEAAPWLIGESEPQHEVDPDELFDKLKPFQERVATDIRDQEDDEQ